MIRSASAEAENENQRATEAVCETHCPPQIASITKMNAKADVSSTLPGRRVRKYTPMSSAIGIVIAMVNVPHGLALSAFTTTSAHTASKITMMLITAI